MAKKIKTIIKLQLPAGKATPAPPVGSTLGAHGLSIQDFIMRFNDATKSRGDVIVPVQVTIYEDRTFDFITKESPVSDMIKKLIKLEKGSSEPNKNKVGKLAMSQVEEIAKAKMPDLNANDIEAAKKIVMGSARSMGVDVEKS